jgi:hypothetical protein
VTLPFSEYRPDVSDYKGQHTRTLLNVLPRGDGYGPFRDFAAYGDALPGPCRGFIKALKSDGSIAIFAATETDIYLFNNTDLDWDVVSQGGGPYTAVPSTDQWQFVQFGDFVIAVQVNEPPQYFDLASPSAFADLAGSPPQCRYASIVGRFLVLSGLLTYPQRIQWSGLGNVTQWTSGVNSSDYQDFPDGGVVRGVAGGETGVILQDLSIRRMVYAPGSPLIFQIERVAEDVGLLAPYSLVRSADKIFFLSSKGFMGLTPTGYPEPIGKEKVDRTVMADIDQSSLQLVLGASDPKSSRVFWAYKSVSGDTALFDKILCYDYALDRFAAIEMSGEYISTLSQPGITLEGLDTISSSIDALPQSLDAYAGSSLPEIAAFDSTHTLGFYNGDTLEATLETPEHRVDGRRMFIRGFSPITDAAEAYGSVSRRENLQATETYTSESAVNGQGFCPLRASTRLSRGKLRIPAAEDWTFASGIEPDAIPEGTR